MIRLFDPWGDSFCTCPKKYSLNPYTGCEHRCLYCYITAYIPRAFEARVKKNLIAEVRQQRKKLDPRLVISIANSSDPYTPMERRFKRTRACLELLRDFKILIITKSDLVTRDIDLFKRMQTCVSITITTIDDDIAARLEPGAPSPERRIKALEELHKAGISVSCRIDPIIPWVNDEVTELVGRLREVGVQHVVSSTYKARPDSWKRFKEVFPREAEKLKRLYFREGMRHGNAWYLPMELREKLMRKVMQECTSRGMEFATCREGFYLRTAKSCDGSHLIGTFNFFAGKSPSLGEGMRGERHIPLHLHFSSALR